MHNSTLIYPMLAHLLWVVLLYMALTVVRAPAVWGIGRKNLSDAELDRLEKKVSANLSNQFEWPLLFYVICVLLLISEPVATVQIWLAWLFFVGRVIHSGVQIFTENIRLRGVIFTINFVAVLLMWANYVYRA